MHCAKNNLASTVLDHLRVGRDGTVFLHEQGVIMGLRTSMLHGLWWRKGVQEGEACSLVSLCTMSE